MYTWASRAAEKEGGPNKGRTSPGSHHLGACMGLWMLGEASKRGRLESQVLRSSPGLLFVQMSTTPISIGIHVFSGCSWLLLQRTFPLWMTFFKSREIPQQTVHVPFAFFNRLECIPIFQASVFMEDILLHSPHKSSRSQCDLTGFFTGGFNQQHSTARVGLLRAKDLRSGRVVLQVWGEVWGP